MHLPGMIKKWRPWAETEDARTEAQHFIERWNTALAAGRAGAVRSGQPRSLRTSLKVIGNTRELRRNWPMLAIKVKSGERPSVLGINVLMKLQMNLQM